MTNEEDKLPGLYIAKELVKTQISISSIPPKKDDSQLRVVLRNINTLIKGELKRKLIG